MLLTVKGNQKTLHRQIRSQFQGKRQIPFIASDHEKRHGRDTTWNLRAKEAPDHIKANWPGCSWIVEVITTVTRKGKRVEQAHCFLTSLRTAPKALLRLVRQRWSIENEWHWVRDVQLGEDAHRYANRIGAPLFSFLRTVVLNLLRRVTWTPRTEPVPMRASLPARLGQEKPHETQARHSRADHPQAAHC